MSDNLPAVRAEAPSVAVVRRDTDSWAEQLPAIVELARSICGTDFVPEAMRDNVAATAAAILYGREVSLPPMTALSNVNIIKGRPGLSAVIMRAQVLAAGHEIRQDASDSSRCVLSGRRRGTDYWQTVTYTIDDARQAGLIKRGKNGEPSMYEKNPRRMLRARATSELCELMFADVVRGMPSLEELEEQDDETPAGPPAKTTRATVQRKARGKTDDGAAGTADPPPVDRTPSAPSSPPLPPLPGEEGYDEPSAAAAAEPDAGAAAAAQSADGEPRVPVAPASTPDPPYAPEQVDEHGQEYIPDVEEEDRPRMITRPQQRAMFGVFNELGIKDDAERLHITQAIVGRTPMHQGKPSSSGLTEAEFKLLVDALARCKTRDHVEALVELAEQERAGSGEQAGG